MTIQARDLERGTTGIRYGRHYYQITDITHYTGRVVLSTRRAGQARPLVLHPHDEVEVV